VATNVLLAAPQNRSFGFREGRVFGDDSAMKSERRHELQTNELADWLTHALDRHRSRLSMFGWTASAVVVAIVVVVVVMSRQGGSQARAWEELQAIGTLEPSLVSSRLKQISETYPNTEVALWAQLDMADVLCTEAKQKLASDRDIAVLRLREAQQAYLAVLNNARALPDMIRRAALPEAMCWELLGDRDQAITAYKRAAERYASSHPEVAKEAASRASDLEQPEAADFYKWLAEYKPPVTTPLAPPSPELGFPPASNGEDKSETPAKEKDDATKPTDSNPAKEPESGSDKKDASTKTDSEKPAEPENSTKAAEPKAESGGKVEPKEPTGSKPSAEPAETAK
jgi:hypothetical protein